MTDTTSRQRPELVQIPDQTAVQTTIPIAEAAARLGISADAVRKRIQRGKLTGHKTDSGWTVDWIEPDPSPEPVQTTVHDQSVLIESLQDQVGYLREQVTAERDARVEAERRHAVEIERRDILLRNALDRIPQIPPSTPSEHTPQDAATAQMRAPVSDDRPAETASLIERVRRLLGRQ